MRTDLTEALRRRCPNTFLFDVHTFPPGGFGPRALDIVLLYVAGNAAFALAVEQHLRTRTKYTILATQGSNVNDILVEAAEHRIPAVLVEFNQQLDNDDVRVIARALAFMPILRSMVRRTKISRK